MTRLALLVVAVVASLVACHGYDDKYNQCVSTHRCSDGDGGEGDDDGGLVLSELGDGGVLEFGAIFVGKSKALTTRLTNRTTRRLTELNPTIQSRDYLVVMPSCDAGLEPAAACDITVTFHPDGSGLRAQDAVISGSANHHATLRLSGWGASVSISAPASLTLTSTDGGAESGTVQVRNIGPDPLVHLERGLTTTDSGFTVLPAASGGCGPPLDVNVSCTYIVTFSPDASGVFYEKLGLVPFSDAGAGSVIIVDLIGEAG